MIAAALAQNATITDTRETVQWIGTLTITYRVLTTPAATFRVRLDTGAVDLHVGKDAWIRLRTLPEIDWDACTTTQCVDHMCKAYWEEQTEVDRDAIRVR